MSSVVFFFAGTDVPVVLHPGHHEENPFGVYQTTEFNKLSLGDARSGFIGVTHTIFDDHHHALVTVYEFVDDRFVQPLDTGLDVGEEARVVVGGKELRIVHNKEEVV